MNEAAENIPVVIEAQPGPQTAFLRSNADVVFYGGAAGGGKTYALLMEPLYDAHANPDFGAVIFRRTTKQVTNEGGLWDTAVDLYQPLRAIPNASSLHLTFPTGARVTFAHMEHEKNRLDWQGAQIPLICFDELTHFTWKQFIYMLSRNRSTCGAKSRVRATLNPDPDHWVRSFIDWWIDDDGFAILERSGVVRYFVIESDEVIWGDSKKELLSQNPDRLPKSFTFIPSKLTDNPILMQSDPSYLASLQSLTRVERAQLLDGNWNVRPTAGTYFQRSDFEIVEAAPKKVLRRVRAWDQAGTKKRTQNKSDDPDWTAGVVMSKGADGLFYIEHVERFRDNPSKVDGAIKNTALQDGYGTHIRLAQDPGQAGKSQAQNQIKMLSGFVVKAKPVTGDKETRAKPLSSQVEAGNVRLVRGKWNEAFLTELENFPDGAHDDQVDAAADAFDELAGHGNIAGLIQM
jgi:predicted phage terminase large subunit-like protein